MEVSFIAQPYSNLQLGTLLEKSLGDTANIRSVTIVSAFTSRSTVIRLKSAIFALHAAKAKIRLVLGVDMGGTSKEVLEELAGWPIEVLIFKNRKSGITFHPKIYTIEKLESAEIYIGSNNLTEGGLFKNYEGAALISYSLPVDEESYARANKELEHFLAPNEPIAKLLDAAFLEKLCCRNDIPSEAEARARAKLAKVGSPLYDEDTFGFEPTPGATRLPIEYQHIVLAAVDQQLKEIQKTKRAAATRAKRDGLPKIDSEKNVIPDIEPMAFVPATAFYMELNATKGKDGNIPGEQRIPLPAIWSAQEFWGWKANYTKDINPRKSKKVATSDAKTEDRIYYNWHPIWEISELKNPDHIIKRTVRMYLYENSSDFRFTCGEIAKWGDPGDIIRIEKIDNGVIDFRCQLAKKGSVEHTEWSKICVGRPDAHTRRGFGFS